MRSVRRETGEGCSSDVLVSTSPGKHRRAVLALLDDEAAPRVRDPLGTEGALERGPRGHDLSGGFARVVQDEMHREAVAAQQRQRIVRGRTDHGDTLALARIEGQDAVVLEHHHALAGHLAGQRDGAPAPAARSRPRPRTASRTRRGGSSRRRCASRSRRSSRSEMRPRPTASPRWAAQSSAGSSMSSPAPNARAAASARSRARLWCW